MAGDAPAIGGSIAAIVTDATPPNGKGIRNRLSAILAADAAGYSRLISVDPGGTVAALDAARAVFLEQVERNGGRVVDTAGDSVLAVFETAAGAVQAGREILAKLDTASAGVAADRRLLFRIGVHLGDVLEKPDGSIYGDGVNIAARLQALADPGGILVSESVRAALGGKGAGDLEDLGERRVKNIATPVRVFRVRPIGGKVRTRRRWRPVAFALASTALTIALGWFVLGDAEGYLRSRLVGMWGSATSGEASERAVVAVMPFANLTGDAGREYLSDGLSEDIIAALGRFPGLLVISQNTMRAYRGRALTPSQLRAELGARYVVQGSLREAGARVRAAVELSDAEKGVLLWSERYEGEGKDVIAVQDQVVNRIVGSVQSRLLQQEQQRVSVRLPEDLEAHDLVLRARALLDRLDRRPNREARTLLAKALDIAPGYAEALTTMGEAEVQRALYGWVEEPADAMARAAELARKALASPDSRAHTRAHVLLARILSNVGSSREALEAAELAVASNPGDTKALFQRGSALLYIGQVGDAVRSIEEARRADPNLGADNGLNLAVAYYISGRYADAAGVSALLRVRFPGDVNSHAIGAASLAMLGKAEEARDAVAQVRRLSPNFQVEFYGARFAHEEHTRKLQDGLRKAGL